MEDLLLLVHRIPYPPNKGDKLRSFHLLKYLGSRYRVHLGTFIDDPEDWQHAQVVRSYCAETHFARLSPAVARIRSTVALVCGEPLTVRYYYDKAFARWIESVVARNNIHRMVAFSSSMAQYLLSFTGANRLADVVDVDSAKWEQYAPRSPWPLSTLYRREGRKLLDFEKRVAATCEATVFVSAAEAALFRRVSGMSSERIHHVGNGVDVDYFCPDNPFPDPYEGAARTLVFTGAMDYRPNIEAVHWFASDVFPRVRQLWPDARFAVVGARPDRTIVRLGDIDGIAVTGTVPDVRPYLAHAAVVVAPLRIARGVQNKVLEGMAMGRTVVASTEAVEGIEARPGTDLLIADTPDEYVSAIRSVFEGTRDLGESARAAILRHSSWKQNIDRMISLLDPQRTENESSSRSFSIAASR